MNRLVLTAKLVERAALRYTPAGLPALDLGLAHESQQTENGQPRKVTLELRGLAIGEVTQALATLALGEPARFAGFLAAGRNGRGIVFHITGIDPGI